MATIDILGTHAGEERLRRFMEAYVEGWADPAGGRLADIWAADAEMMHPEFEEPMRGREAIMEYLRQWSETVPDLRVEPRGLALNGDTLFVHFRTEGTFFGRRLAWEGVDRFELDGDRAVRGVGFFDTTRLREAAAAAGAI